VGSVQPRLTKPSQTKRQIVKITPQQALERIQANAPTSISRKGDTGWEATSNGEAFKIDWPKGVDQWPPKTWRIPTDEDALLRPLARFRNVPGDEWHTDRTLVAVITLPANGGKHAFASCLPSTGYFSAWRYCEIEDVTPSTSVDASCALEKVFLANSEDWRVLVTHRDGVEAGDGFRLLDRDERVEKGDEYRHENRLSSSWSPSYNWNQHTNGEQSTRCTYRRRLKQPSHTGTNLEPNDAYCT